MEYRVSCGKEERNGSGTFTSSALSMRQAIFEKDIALTMMVSIRFLLPAFARTYQAVNVQGQLLIRSGWAWCSIGKTSGVSLR